jgi:plastocyanin
MRSARLTLALGMLTIALACGGEKSAPTPAAPAGATIDPATAGTLNAIVTFEGEVPKADPIVITGDPKCVAENDGPQRASETLLVGDNKALQNVFVYVKDGLNGFVFPIPTQPVVLDQDKCRYSPRVLGVRVGQPLQIRNSDPLLHNVRSNAVINQAFNKSTPVEGMTFDHAFATREVMVPFKCDVHGWMAAYVGVIEHPYFATTGVDGKATIANLPPGTYTIEAWHESLGTKTQQITIGAKETKDVSFSFAR